MISRSTIHTILESRKALIGPRYELALAREQSAEGGCGVIGIVCSERIPGRHLLQSLIQMRNRGNGKGGGVAAVGLSPEAFGVSPAVMQDDYLLVVAYLDPDCRAEVEAKHITPTFEVDHLREAPHLDDHTALGLDVRPPEVVQYFVRVKADAYDAFQAEHNLDLTRREVEVLALVVEGQSNNQIAHKLGISPSTARFHVSTILSKLGAANRAGAAATAVKHGLVP